MNLLNLVKGINSILWSYILIFLLCGVGIFLTIKLGFVQIKKFKSMFKQGFSRNNKKKETGITSFQALATAVAAQVGTGNLAGAATAIVAGGPGAIFWMWISAFFGMGTIFSEAVLAQKFRVEKKNGEILGGPAYYIERGFGSRKLGMFFALALICSSWFTGNMVQTNSIAVSMNKSYNISGVVTGVIIAILTAMVIFGGIKRIASVTEKIVPVMALFFIFGSLVIIIGNHQNIIPAFEMIFKGAFNPKAATGGLIGVTIKQAMRYGISRGLFSNEAGMGSTPHAHAIANVEHPVEQGLVAMLGVFIDTFVVLTCTALVILTTGALDGKITGIELTQQAFINGFGGFGSTFISVSLFFFAFSTIIGWYFFGELNVKFIFGDKGVNFYKILFLIFLVIGSVIDVPLVWELADTFNGIMVIPNLIAILGLYKLVAKELKDYNENFLKNDKKIN